MPAHLLHKLLVPIDFSDASINALNTAIAIAERQQSEILLLHVVSTTHGMAFPEGAVMVDLAVCGHIESCQQKLDNVANEVREKHPSVTCQTSVVAGAICPIIVDEATQWQADLIVMGTHGASGLREFFIGSNAYAIVKKAPCPVLTVPPYRVWKDFKKILFPVRPVADALVKYDFARKIILKNETKLIVLGLLENRSEKTVDSLYADTAKLIRILGEDKVHIEMRFESCDSVARKILEETQREDIDLVIITATLDYEIQDFFIGPFAQQVVNHAKVPVLSIRPQPVIMPRMQPTNTLMQSVVQPLSQLFPNIQLG